MVTTELFHRYSPQLFDLLHVSNNHQHIWLQVWGLFAPKFVFDVVGLILTDVLILLAWLYYFGKENKNDADYKEVRSLKK